MTPYDNAAAYFQKILLKKTIGNEPYPIGRLIGHRNVAPVDVCSVVRVADDLKALFLNYPDLFCVKKGFVSLVRAIKTDGVQASAYDISQTVYDYYKSLLFKSNKFCPFNLDELFKNLSSAPPVVQAAVKNIQQLKYYFQINPSVFTLYRHYVVLTESVDNINDIVSFFVNALEHSPEKTCTYQELLAFSLSGPQCVQIAKMNAFKIKQFLLCFTKTFKIKHRSAVLTGNQSFIMVQNPQRVKTPSLNDSISDSPESSDSSSYATSQSDDLESIIKNLNNFRVIDNHDIAKSKSPNDNLQTKAANYFLEKLWSLKQFKVVPILTLYSYKSTAPSNIQSVCGKTPEGFKLFLSSFVDSFIVTGEFVLPRKNIPKKEWCPPYKGVEEQLCSVLHNFFKSITSNGRTEHVEKLFHETGRYFLSNSGERFFETSDDLAKFLGMFPESFYIFNDHVINILNYDEEGIIELRQKICKRAQQEAEEEFPIELEDFRGESESWKETVLNKTEFVSDLEICKIRAKELIEKETVIALDCEGLNLGIDGILSLIQIGTESGNVYIFDVLKVPDMLVTGLLKDICESNSILKVIHDCRNDSANLFYEFKVQLRNVFDTRLAHGVIAKQHNKPIAFNKLCEKYGAPINVEKDEFKDVYRTNPGFWLNRPMTENMLAYAALDVACLVPHVYGNMKKKLKKPQNVRVMSLSERASKTYL